MRLAGIWFNGHTGALYPFVVLEEVIVGSGRKEISNVADGAEATKASDRTTAYVAVLAIYISYTRIEGM